MGHNEPAPASGCCKVKPLRFIHHQVNVEWGMVALMSLIRIYGKEETHKVHVLTIEVLQF
jgi:hypothetical protein